jgi:hypothetical protein
VISWWWLLVVYAAGVLTGLIPVLLWLLAYARSWDRAWGQR